MSKFTELVDLVNEVTEENIKFREECVKFASKIVKGVVEYFDIPRDQIRIVPSENAEDRHYPMLEALSCDSNLYWHFGIILFFTKNIFPQRALLLRISFKKEGDHYSVSLDNSEPNIDFDISEDVQKDFESFFDSIYVQIRKTYDDNRFQFYHPDEPRQIGF